MSKVIFITVRSSTKDQWLNDKMLQITRSCQEHLVNGRYPTYVLDSYSSINDYLDKADWLFIQSAGDYILDFDHIWSKIHELTPDLGLVGHLTWNSGCNTPYLENQCFIINTKSVKHIDFDVKKDQGRLFSRSEEDLHKGHAPLWLGLTDELVTRYDRFGTVLMETIIDNGFKVVNFDESWRYGETTKVPSSKDLKLPTRGFLYPETNTDIFSQCLKTLDIDPRLDEAQALAILVINQTLGFKYFNALHWDDTVTDKKADVVIAPANGLMAEVLAYYSGAKKIIMYDINPNNIKFKQHLYDNFVSDYVSFYEQYSKDQGLDIEPKTDFGKSMVNWGEVETVLDNWNDVKHIEKEYIYGDIITIVDTLVDMIEPNSILHTSTILGFYIFSNILHDQSEIAQAVDKIQKRVEETQSVWLGER